MCLNPIRIPNVNYRSTNPVILALKRDTTHAFMEVPCGRCEQCVAARQNDFVQRVQAESRFNHLFFATLTYDNEHLPKLVVDVPVVTPPDPEFCFGSGEDLEAAFNRDPADLVPIELPGLESQVEDDPEVDYRPITFPYADIHDLQLMIKNVRDNNPVDGRTLRYAAVSELGKSHARPHFHLIWFVESRPGDFDPNGKPIRSKMIELQTKLYHCVRKYWAENVGTRKNPVYVPRFRYAKKWYFNKVYTNFDLHWVDPSLTDGQTSNVAYYVSKYMMKGSDHDARRQQFLRLNLSEDVYQSVWKVIKCRMVCSKGLGLDARFETFEHEQEVVDQQMPLWKYAEALDLMSASDDDLPDFDSIKLVKKSVRVVKKRLMIPNFLLAEKVRSELSNDVGVSPGPIFIDVTGKHRPLSHYYQRFGYIYALSDAISIINSYTGPEKSDPTKEESEQAARRMAKRVAIVDAHSSFDNLATTDVCQMDPSIWAYIQ